MSKYVGDISRPTEGDVGWLIDSLRFSVAIDSRADFVDVAGLWWDTLGLVPEEEIIRDRGSRKEIHGTYDGFKLKLIVLPDRLDWLLEYGGDPVSISAAYRELIGPYPAAQKSFVDLVKRWILHMVASDTHFPRLAWGVTLVHLVSSNEEGMDYLQRFLPGVNIDAAARDFMYRINRPRSYSWGNVGQKTVVADEELLVNRVAHWRTAHRVRGGISFDQLRSAVSIEDYILYSACLLTLDMNVLLPAPTHRGSLIISTVDEDYKDKVEDLFFELVRNAEEIAEQGDIV